MANPQHISPPIVAQMLWGDVRIHHLREDKHGHLFVQLEIQNVDTSIEQKLLLREYWTDDRQLKVTIEDAEHAYYNDLTGTRTIPADATDVGVPLLT